MHNPFRKISAVAAASVIAAGGLLSVSSPASAGTNITCNNVSDAKSHTYITHTCTGTGTLTYSRPCVLGKAATTTYKFTGGKEHVRLDLDCGWKFNRPGVTYTVS